MKLCKDCKHSITSDSPIDAGTLKCKLGGWSPVDGRLFQAYEVRIKGVVGYDDNGEMKGLTSCAPIGYWFEEK